MKEYLSPYPTLFIDLEVVRSNIRKMYQKSIDAGVEFRPHFKTHQSKVIGRMFRDFNISGITVSSLKMAKYFADDGWKDITIAFPVNILAASDYDALAGDIDLKSLVISDNAVRALDKQLTHRMGLYIEIDPAYGRSGIPADNLKEIETVKKAIDHSTHCHFAGFYCHAGHTYKARSINEIKDIAEKAILGLQALKNKYSEASICYGDTPSCSVLSSFGPANQISPGNFIIYDWMQVGIGSCKPEEIAVYMECPIIEKFDSRKELLIHGGAVHFSKEAFIDETKISFGQIVTKKLNTDNYISKISQEHGIIKCSPSIYNNLNIGDRIKIYPIHSCLTANLMGEYYTLTGDKLNHMNS